VASGQNENLKCAQRSEKSAEDKVDGKEQPELQPYLEKRTLKLFFPAGCGIRLCFHGSTCMQFLGPLNAPWRIKKLKKIRIFIGRNSIQNADL
jgi:hypothetical protein